MKKIYLLFSTALLSTSLLAQNVGVNVPTPLEKLDVAGAIRITTATNANDGTIQYNGTDFLGHKAGAWVSLTATSGVSGSGTLNYIPKWTSSTALGNSLMFDNGTNIGIGTNSPSLAKLQVQGMAGNTTAIFSGAANSQGVAFVSDWPGIYFNSYYNGGIRSMASSGYPAQINIDQALGGIGFSTTTTANSSAGALITLSERMRIAGDGNVGIGTASPDGKLNVRGDASGSYYQLTLQANTTSTSTGIMFKSGGTTDALIHHEGSYNTGYLEIEDYSSTWTGIGLVIKQNNVGIGTLSPSYKLDVNGNARASILYDYENASYYLDPASISVLNDVRAAIFYDASNTSYYLDPANSGTSALLAGNVGIGTITPANKLDVEGGLAVGASYSGAIAAPANGAIIEGSVGIGVSSGLGALLDITGTDAGTNSLLLRSGNSNASFSSSQIVFGYNATSSYAHAIKTRHRSAGQSGNAIDLCIFNYASPSNIIKAVTITGDNGGSLGIGTTGPARALHVVDVMRLEPRSAAPSSAGEGDIYYDNIIHKLRVYDGSSWQDCW